VACTPLNQDPLPSNGVLANPLEYTVNWDIAWAAVLAGFAAVFVPLELKGTTDWRDGKKNYGTLSATLRRWLGIDPQLPRRWPLRIGFAALLLWFGIHILTPWL
jgi:hypothetical protein